MNGQRRNESASVIAVGQFAPGADSDANLAAMGDLAGQAVAQGATLIVFPEYSSYFGGELGPHWVAAAEGLDGDFVAGLGAMAKALGVHVVAGMLEATSEPSRFSNTLIAVSAEGAVEAVYRKIHLYDAFGQRESDWVAAGPVSEPETFGWEGFTVGLQTCYDLRFPEVTRRIVDAGANLVLVPSQWVSGPNKQQHWRTLLTARAIENTIYVAAADHVPPVAVGNSMVIDPMGVELVTIANATGVAVAELELSRLAAVRRLNPSLALRRLRVTPL
jgi:predicted amidohydrolase